MGKGKKKADQNAKKDQRIDIKQMIALQEELDELRRAHPEAARAAGAEVKPNWFERLSGKYLAWKEKYGLPKPVARKPYLWLHLLGIFGVHQFYAGHWVKGLLYLAICWSGITVGLTLLDWASSFPKKADENGIILV